MVVKTRAGASGLQQVPVRPDDAATFRAPQEVHGAAALPPGPPRLATGHEAHVRLRDDVCQQSAAHARCSHGDCTDLGFRVQGLQLKIMKLTCAFQMMYANSRLHAGAQHTPAVATAGSENGYRNPLGFRGLGFRV